MKAIFAFFLALICLPTAVLAEAYPACYHELLNFQIPGVNQACGDTVPQVVSESYSFITYKYEECWYEPGPRECDEYGNCYGSNNYRREWTTDRIRKCDCSYANHASAELCP